MKVARFCQTAACDRRTVAIITIGGQGGTWLSLCGQHALDYLNKRKRHKVLENEIPLAFEDSKDPDAVSLGRRGGRKGGPARAAALTAQERAQAAEAAARARWAKEGLGA